jgi:hypothetical protein
LAGFWVRLQRRSYAPKTTGSLRSGLADFLRHLAERGRAKKTWRGDCHPSAIPGVASWPRTRGRLRKFAWSWIRSIGNRRSENVTTRWSC